MPVQACCPGNRWGLRAAPFHRSGVGGMRDVEALQLPTAAEASHKNRGGDGGTQRAR
ncbi:hypothetical protein GCM10009661_60250 [Catellatospora chokoriensis]